MYPFTSTFHSDKKDGDEHKSTRESNELLSTLDDESILAHSASDGSRTILRLYFLEFHFLIP